MSTSPRAIGVVMWISEDYGRRVLSGVLEHYRETSDVDVLTIPADQSLRSPVCRALDGIIAPLKPQAVLRWKRYRGIPMVAVPRLASIDDMTTVTTVTMDQAWVGTAAAEHFIALRLRQVALCADPHEGDLGVCQQALRQAAGAAGLSVLPSPHLRRRTDWAIDAWLKTLPTPIGILACDDIWARRLVQRAESLGLRVPDDLAILGLGNAPITCRSGGIGLSSMALPAEAMGRRAALALDDLLTGQAHPNVTMKPLGIASRASTETLCVDDPVVAAVTQQIRRRFLESPGTALLAYEQGLARRTLDQRYRIQMGCSIHDEIVRCRLSWATGMLADSSTPIKVIAERMGMQMSNFSRFIREHTGCSPRDYRRNCLSES